MFGNGPGLPDGRLEGPCTLRTLHRSHGFSFGFAEPVDGPIGQVKVDGPSLTEQRN